MINRILFSVAVLFSIQSLAAIEVMSNDVSTKGGSFYHSFGSQRVMSSQTTTYVIKNSGPEVLNRTDFIMYGGDFSAYTDCPVVMEVGKKCYVDITFWPMFEGWKTGDLYMNFDIDQLHWFLSGTAVRQ